MITKHFADRVSDRISPDIDAHDLAQELCLAIELGREDLVSRVCRIAKGRTTYRFNADGVGERFAVRDREGRWISVLTPSMWVLRNGKRRIRLSDQ